MTTTDLQNSIIRKILDINDNSILEYLNSFLSVKKDESIYKLSNEEKVFLEESLTEYKKGNTLSNDEIFNKNDRWLNEG